MSFSLESTELFETRFSILFLISSGRTRRIPQVFTTFDLLEEEYVDESMKQDWEYVEGRQAPESGPRADSFDQDPDVLCRLRSDVSPLPLVKLRPLSTVKLAPLHRGSEPRCRKLICGSECPL